MKAPTFFKELFFCLYFILSNIHHLSENTPAKNLRQFVPTPLGTPSDLPRLRPFKIVLHIGVRKHHTPHGHSSSPTGGERIHLTLYVIYYKRFLTQKLNFSFYFLYIYFDSLKKWERSTIDTIKKS